MVLISRPHRNVDDFTQVCDNEVYDYQLSPEAVSMIMHTIGCMQPEQLAMLGADQNTGVITEVHHDRNARRAAGECTPDNEVLQRTIDGDWAQRNIRFAGIVHSHPGKYSLPSEGDRIYAERILHAMPQTLAGMFFMPIVNVDRPMHAAVINPYVAVLDPNSDKAVVCQARIFVNGELLTGPQKWSDWDAPARGFAEKKEDNAEQAARVEELMEPSDVEVTEPADCGKELATAEKTACQLAEVPAVDDKREERFRRVRNLLPLEELEKATVVSVGVGGGRAFIIALARSGIRRFVLVERDTVSRTNTATQATFEDELEKPKTEAIAAELHRIDPDIEVIELRAFLDDDMTDEVIEVAIGQELLQNYPHRVLLCGCTDSFAPQDRTVKLALKWGVPYLAGQNYAEGLAGEVVFTYPGVTATCPRCMLASRYNAYEDTQNSIEPVTSDDAPIYATDQLNAIKTHIALMLLTYGTDCRIGRELDIVKDRNLVLFSNSPLSEEKLGIGAFSRVFAALDEEERRALLVGGVVWLKQKPDRPENGFPYCPYCGGCGDLRMLRGLMSDTRRPLNLRPFISAVLPVQDKPEEIS